MFMHSIFWTLVVGILACTSALLAQQQAGNAQGVIHVSSSRNVQETINRLESEATSRGLKVFARIDFAADAEKAGLKLPPKQLLIFGNPKAGTPLMVSSQTVALDLPLKALAWEDADGKTWLSYNSPEYLKERHGLPDELMKNISGIAALVKKATDK